MGAIADKAVKVFGEGCNCAQSVLIAAGEPFGLDRDLAVQLAEGFGGGMCYSGQACGAVTGAIMAVGLKCDRVHDGPEGRQKADETVRELIRRFRAAHGDVVTCNELIGMDLADPDALAEARRQNLFRDRCPRFVRTAADILEEILIPPSTEGQAQ